jgi:hypothetical protein
VTDLVVSPGTDCLTCPEYQPPGVPVVLVASTGDTSWWACTDCAVRIENALAQ